MKSLLKISIALFLCSGLFLSSCNKDDENSVLVNLDSLPLRGTQIWNGSDGSGSFKATGITFPNSYNSEWSYWNGFAYSKMHDVKTLGFTNQYSSYALKDSSSTSTFVLAYPNPDFNTITFDNPVSNLKMKVTNSTYSALSMKYGDVFSKKFGGADSTESDWFKLLIIGINQDGTHTDTASIYLADYRFSSKKQDYIVSDWLPVNLAKLGEVKKVIFELSSSDNGKYGMNTPGYFCLDDIEYTPAIK